jgi:hypothetical protein
LLNIEEKVSKKRSKRSLSIKKEEMEEKERHLYASPKCLRWQAFPILVLTIK